MKTKRGFTLIELLITIMIVTILAAIVTPMIADNSDRAKLTEAMAAIGIINSAGQVYELETGSAADQFSSIEHLAEVGLIRIDNLNGVYFDSSDYIAWEFNEHGRVLRLTAGQWDIVWEDNRYKVVERRS